jgi:hypothetical protein
MATKYFGTAATDDKISFRFNNPETYVIRPDFTLKITPYSDMYIGIEPTKGVRVNVRAKAGQKKTIPYPIASATADITNIFGARFIQEIDDLSAGYIGDGDFSKASRLQKLSIGKSVPRIVSNLSGFVGSSDINSDGIYEYSFDLVDTTVSTLYKNIKIKSVTSEDGVLTKDSFALIEKDGNHHISLVKKEGTTAINTTYTFEIEYDAYFNNYLTEIGLGNNVLLEELDIRNVSGLQSAIDLARCSNLRKLDADGAGATGVIFANGGRLQSAILPKIKTLTAKNLNELTEFKVASYENLETVIIENCPTINSYEIVSQAPSLSKVRLIDIEWPRAYNITDGKAFDRLAKMRGEDSAGVEKETSVVTGNAHIQNIRQSQLDQYSSLWNNQLKLTYDYLIRQYTARFLNEGILVDTQLVDEGARAEDPTTRTDKPIAIPTKDSTIALKYFFAGWDPATFEPMYGDKVYSAVYNSEPMQYTISYTGLGVQPYSKTVNYGEVVEYPYETPTHSSEANVYYWFQNWDKSGYANADKTITAQYDTCSYNEGYFKTTKLGQLRPVELYMLTQMGGVFNLKTDTEYLNQQEMTLKFGNDFNYDVTDINNKVLIETPMTFNGSTKLDTNEILLHGKKDFVLAVDFERGENSNATMFQCYNNNSGAGFRVNCDSN